jgi:hypothetical protein
MRNWTWGLGAVLAVGLWIRPAAGEDTRHVVVRVTAFDKQVTTQVMPVAEAQALQQEIRAETPLFGRAMMEAANEWRQIDARRRQPFPSHEFGARQIMVMGAPHPNAAAAEAALRALSPGGASMPAGGRRPGGAGAAERERTRAEAFDIFMSHMDQLKADASIGGAGAGGVAEKLALTPGQVLTRTAEGPTKVTYHIAVPETYDPARPPPLLILFSPGGDGRGMMNFARAAANKLGWMVVGADRLRNGMDEKEAAAIERDLMADVRTQVTYDRRRLFYGGFSGGAMRAYLLTMVQRDRCAGILAFGGWLGGREKQAMPFQRRMRVAIVNGASDAGARTWEDQDRDALRRKQCEVRIFHFPGGHALPPPDILDQALEWLNQT